MRKHLAICFISVLCSCSSGTPKGSKPLYEILTQQADGGARISFYEYLTEAKEIKMLQNDPQLRKKINENELSTCNFVILNAGEKETFGYQFAIDHVTETKDSILWIGSTIGLLRFNKNSLSIERTYTTKDNLSNHFIYGIVHFRRF